MRSDHYSGGYAPALSYQGIITTLDAGRMDPCASIEIGDTHEKEVTSNEASENPD
jgi:hypothetical protein